ncbi:MAG: HPr-rel-A system PqqD family peptide chaperone, partial [Lamprocystis purpurea]|nr:HPr-rel-A system PqqD family peptide chaperone [Lamprocystis purpurea]
RPSREPDPVGGWMKGTTPGGDRYLSPADTRVVATWGAESSVYCRRTGDTHLLSILPAELLAMLPPEPTDLETITTRMARSCAQPVTPEWTARIRSMLDELVRLELVDRLPE